MKFDLISIWIAGIATVFTPCVLPLIPIYLSVLLETQLSPIEGRSIKTRLIVLSNVLAFSVGFIIIFSLMGLSSSLVGSYLVKNKAYLSIVGGIIIFLLGLKFIGWLNIPFLDREIRYHGKFKTKSSLITAFLLGVVFALGWTPCVGPILGAVLTYTAAQTVNLWEGAFYLAIYGFGFATPLFLFSLFSSSITKFIKSFSDYLPKIERIIGVLIIGSGIYLIYSSFSIPSPIVDGKFKITVEDLKNSSYHSSNLMKTSPGASSLMPRMVEFYSPSCSICRQMIPILNVLKRECSSKGVEIIQIDITNPSNKPLLSKYGIRAIPTFVFLDKDGKEVSRLIGYQTIHSLQQHLAVLLGKDSCAGVQLLDIEELEGASKCEQSNKEVKYNPGECKL